MAKLTTADRAKLPQSSFALPAQRKYPVDTHNRAANAKARASQAVNAGRMSKSTEATIDRKANVMLGHSSVQNPRSHQGKLHSC